MKPVLFAAFAVIAAPSLAAAQSPGMEEICATVARNFEMVKAVKIGVVQSFPELKPPGARLTYSTKMAAEDTDIRDTIECQFETASAPYKLLEFCLGRTCYSADEKDPVRRRRFEEARSLLDRQK
ncbi:MULTISPECIES: hypothetical protein [Alphaproteobacteria]|uniref:Uncharacterized protein n=2 Tax=Alphaproteobacteria TaxID=28211 RepID=A0A512HEH1_9HYPH|nr:MULTISPECIES: hypothetical protein [Alphaproteobacteria]GEO83853.1 hypothetical protein RNA01_07850 [Ciceribacter naphthalenivorans]GLR21269.1 hypothetical protein GCM10007920_10550 [Ciceribacter naphthalenivorans]GLT04125.1 hypothetical protein GCM10007926_10550 [Sphingomonas psychrolutea]